MADPLDNILSLAERGHREAQGPWLPLCWLWGILVAYVVLRGIVRGARFG